MSFGLRFTYVWGVRLDVRLLVSFSYVMPMSVWHVNRLCSRISISCDTHVFVWYRRFSVYIFIYTYMCDSVDPCLFLFNITSVRYRSLCGWCSRTTLWCDDPSDDIKIFCNEKHNVIVSIFTLYTPYNPYDVFPQMSYAWQDWRDDRKKPSINGTHSNTSIWIFGLLRELFNVW